MRGVPLTGLRSAGSDRAGSACLASATPRRSPGRRHRWSRLDVANAIGIVFGLSCILWLPAQAAVTAVVASTQTTAPAAPSAAPLVAVAQQPVAENPGFDGARLDDDVAGGISAGQAASPEPAADGSPQPAPTSRIVVRSKPASVTKPTNVAQPNGIPAGGAATPQPAPVPAAAPATYTRDLYNASLFRYQDPDGTACTAAATEVMLNLTRGRGTTGDGFVWSSTTSYQTQEAILAWERANDTLDAGAPGSDPHGWRNALNYYGWGSYATFGARHYEDLSYASFAAATKAAVIAIARENKPVGILAWSGGHAQIMTGYEVYGSDPAVSADFSVLAVYLTDPLASSSLLDARVTYAGFQSGSTLYRFTSYNWKDSGADDPYMPGSKASYTEWYGKWVIIAPVSYESAAPGAH